MICTFRKSEVSIKLIILEIYFLETTVSTFTYGNLNNARSVKPDPRPW
jgi:hypothetical protein